MTAAWINAFLGRLEARDVQVREESAPGLAPARLYVVRADDWGMFAHEAKNWECRWVAGWGEDAGETATAPDLMAGRTSEASRASITSRGPADVQDAQMPRRGPGAASIPSARIFW